MLQLYELENEQLQLPSSLSAYQCWSLCNLNGRYLGCVCFQFQNTRLLQVLHSVCCFSAQSVTLRFEIHPPASEIKKGLMRTSL